MRQQDLVRWKLIKLVRNSSCHFLNLLSFKGLLLSVLILDLSPVNEVLLGKKAVSFSLIVQFFVFLPLKLMLKKSCRKSR